MFWRCSYLQWGENSALATRLSQIASDLTSLQAPKGSQEHLLVSCAQFMFLEPAELCYVINVLIVAPVTQ